MTRCSVCGGQVASDVAFCSHCGARVAAVEEPGASDTLRDIAQELDRALREHPNDTNARYQLALALMYDNRWGPAAEHLLEVVRLTPEFADAHANLAVCLARLGQLDRALEAIGAALALSPDRQRFQRLRDQISAARGSAQ